MATTTDLDTGVATLPAARPSAFSPPAFANGAYINRPPVASDTGTGSTPAPSFNNVDDITTIPVLADPGY